jgi:signal transduction histidine kinase
VINAIRHIPADGSVRIVAASKPDGALRAVDDGCGGIPEADLARVFDLAWRGTHPGGPGSSSSSGSSAANPSPS